MKKTKLKKHKRRPPKKVYTPPPGHAVDCASQVPNNEVTCDCGVGLETEKQRLYPLILTHAELDVLQSMVDFHRSDDHDYLDTIALDSLGEKAAAKALVAEPDSVVFLLYEPLIPKQDEVDYRPLVGVVTRPLSESEWRHLKDGYTVDEWREGKLYRHHFRDSFGGWGWEPA